MNAINARIAERRVGLVTWNIHGERAPLSAKFCLEGMSGAGGRRHPRDPTRRSWPIPRRPALPPSRAGQLRLRVRPAPAPVGTARRLAGDLHARTPSRTLHASHPDALRPAPRPHRAWPAPGLRRRVRSRGGPGTQRARRAALASGLQTAQPNFPTARRTDAFRPRAAPAPPPHPHRQVRLSPQNTQERDPPRSLS